MQQFTPDDSSIIAPEANTPGVQFMAEVQSKARAIYPDHGESRAKYVAEMAAVEINRLHSEVERLKDSDKFLNKAIGLD